VGVIPRVQDLQPRFIDWERGESQGWILVRGKPKCVAASQWLVGSGDANCIRGITKADLDGVIMPSGSVWSSYFHAYDSEKVATKTAGYDPAKAGDNLRIVV
jgi:hypothetical protein